MKIQTSKTLGLCSSLVLIVAFAACDKMEDPAKPVPVVFQGKTIQPVVVDLGEKKATQISAGRTHTCALLETKEVACWGSNDSHEIGDENKKAVHPAVNIVKFDKSFEIREVVAANRFSCALGTNGHVQCWGSNVDYQLGQGIISKTLTAVDKKPPLTSGSGYGIENSLDAELTRAAGVEKPAEKLVSVEEKSKAEPAPVLADDSKAPFVGAEKLVPTPEGICAINESGAPLCWGKVRVMLDDSPVSGKKEVITQLQRLMYPTQLKSNESSPWESGVSSLAIGKEDSCAVVNGTDLSCFSWVNEKSAPIKIKAEKIFAGHSHFCIQSPQKPDALFCWGDNQYGQLGTGTAGGGTETPHKKEWKGLPISSLTTGANHTCAIMANTVYCWGDNENGQIGANSTLEVIPKETAVTGVRNAVSVSAGESHTCAIDKDGKVWCWGSNSNGQLGPNGT